jgi:hypothetical protein
LLLTKKLKEEIMYLFVLCFVVFYAIVAFRFQSAIKPTLSAIQANKISLPDRLIEGWLLVTATLFPLNSVLRARKSEFQLKDSLGFMALILGVFLGMIADVSTTNL